MIQGQFSRTALTAAAFRAAHQTCEGASLLVDPLTARVLGEDLPFLLERASDPAMRPLRVFVALRSRIAEDAARSALNEGARQIVVLGAGLDTFACRLAPLGGLRVFEVDHPSTQAEKRRRLAQAGIPAPDHLMFTPCDFETGTLSEALAQAGFDASLRTAFVWLGVTPYLTQDVVLATLAFVAGLAGGADIVFDYANPVASIDSPGHRLFHERMAERVAALGEAFRSHFETAELHARLRDMGFTDIVDLGPREIAAVTAPGSPSPPENGGHIIHAYFRAA